MRLKRIFPFLVTALFFFALAYAYDLVSKEAVNYFQEGVKAQKGANFPVASTNYQKALLLDPNNAEWQKYVLNNLGIIYAKLGDFARAEAVFNEVLKKDPNYKPAQFNLGFVYEKTRPRLQYLEYWVRILELQNLKPKDFIIEEGPEEKQKK